MLSRRPPDGGATISCLFLNLLNELYELNELNELYELYELYELPEPDIYRFVTY